MEKIIKYKDSEVEWIGEIPEHWHVKKLKYVAKVQPSNVDKKSNDGEQSVLLCNYMDVYKNEVIDDSISFMDATATESEIEKFKLKRGDVLVTKDSETPDDIANSAFVTKDYENVLCGYHLAQIRPDNKQLIGEYLFNLFHSHKYKDQFMVAANGVTRYGLGVDAFNDAFVPLPQKDEQGLIGKYLKEKSSLIKTLISKKQALIELLNDEKTALINQAVTKGINHKVRTKDSGFDWIGKIPTHWEIKKLKWFTRTNSGGTPQSTNQKDYYNGNIPWVRTLDLNDSEVNETEIKITDKALSETNCKINPIYTVMVAMYGGEGTIGKSGILMIEAASNQAVCNILPNDVFHPKYLHYFMIFYRPYWMITAQGTRRDPNISQDDIKNVFVTFPPLVEQKIIAEFIEKKIKDISEIIIRIEKEIDLISEYKSSLINEVVTGKFKVY